MIRAGGAWRTTSPCSVSKGSSIRQAAALREFFAADWSPAPGVKGRICEPGHHYEWAFLLDRWARLTGRSKPEPVSRLIAFADAQGLDALRGVAINAVLADGAIHDPVARLWPQAERVRAYLADRRAEEDVASAIKGLRRFLATPKQGLWFDQLSADDRFVLEPARATSLYHLIGAVAELAAAIPAPAKSHSHCWRFAQAFAARDLSRDRGLVFHVASPAHGARSPQRRLRGACGDQGRSARPGDRGRRIPASSHVLAPRQLDPRDHVRLVREVRMLYRKIEPDLAHHVALPSTVVGTLAATGLPVRCLNAMTGLGTMFSSDGIKLRIGRAILTLALRRLLARPRSVVLVQNPDDRAVVERLGVPAVRIALIPGSGVDIHAMRPSPEPAGPITVAFVGRLVGSKGIRTLLAAHERLGRRGLDIRLLIAGVPDPANPTSLSRSEVEAWRGRPNVRHLGFVEDIAALWACAHIAVLPSHREGTPLSLLEAAACGRPLIATDVPGCRNIARPGVNALLVPPEHPDALADAIERLAADADLRRKFGQASRVLAAREFSSERVGRDLVDLYRRLLDLV